LKYTLKFGSRPKTVVVDQNQFICLPKVVDQNRMFSLPKTFLVDQKSCAENFCHSDIWHFAQFSIFLLNPISKQFYQMIINDMMQKIPLFKKMKNYYFSKFLLNV
jgi:hypothetical protein